MPSMVSLSVSAAPLRTPNRNNAKQVCRPRHPPWSAGRNGFFTPALRAKALATTRETPSDGSTH